MGYRLIKITEDDLHYTDEHHQPQRARVHELIWQEALSRFSEADRITIHQQAQNDHGEYAADRCGRLLWTPLDMKPLLSILCICFLAFALMSVMCVSQNTAASSFTQPFLHVSDMLYIPMAFLCLEVLQELFGKKAAQSTIISISLVLILMGIVLSATLYMPGLFRGQNEASYLTIFQRFPSSFLIYGLTLILVHVIQTRIFNSLRHFSMIRNSLGRRLLLSTCLAQLSFTLISAGLICIYEQCAFSHGSMLFHVTCSNHLFRMCVAFAGCLVVYLLIKIAHTWGRKKSAMEQLHQSLSSEIS